METPLLDNVKSANAITASLSITPEDHDHLRPTPPKPLEQIFLTMHHRKMQRDLNGPQKKKRKYHFVALACLLILIYGLSAYSNRDGEQNLAITLTIQQIVLIGVWIFVSIVITAIFGSSKFIVLLYWMLVYWPLLAILASLLFHGKKEIFGGADDSDDWITYGFVIAEIFTFLTFIVTNYVYPKLVTSRWFRETYGATRFWRIRMIDESATAQRSFFAMEYDGMWGKLSKRYQCRYVGEVNDDGLPHGQGVWSDDSYNGEVLTGTWDNGRPVAPYSSRQYGGKGNTFSAVRVAFFMATDDSWEANRMIPSNDGPPRCGVASVECSIAGDFMSHLPEAALLAGRADPGVESDHDLTIGTCCRMLDNGSSQSHSLDKPVTSLQIDANDIRGVQIGGHMYAPTGLPYTQRLKEIIINVIKAERPEDEVLGYVDREEENAMQQNEEGERAGYNSFRLEVKNWMKVDTKDALIFIPGFNSWLEHSLQTFGQMVAMTRMGRNVYPVLFAYPGGQVPTYRQASIISASENNRAYFLQMLRGLQSEGIQNIHIVSHSLGVQTLMNVFEDNSDGSPSLVSQCFGPAPTNGDASRSALELGKLNARSITMLNPDFPVHAFRERGFRSIRRVASLITVVGDRADQALFWSSLLNGISNSLKYPQPGACESTARMQESGFHLQQPIGRNVDSLYVEEGTDMGTKAMVLQHRGSISKLSKREAETASKMWLDCDVIDTTGLDTNVNDLRHSAYNVNSILLRDIEELIVTGKRASERTTLLHKKGNVYEYCHAPSFVKM